MAENPRLEDLRRRVQLDPSSIAFAQLAEEYRRAGQLQEAVDVCRNGLTIHPTYLSARVTLGRALLDLQQFEDAQQELEQVLRSAPENLAAIRGLAEIHHRRGSLAEALVQYRAALALARNDPDLEQTVSDLEYQLQPQQPESDDGLSFDEAAAELFVDTPDALAPPVWAGVEQAQLRAVRTIAVLEQWLQAIAVINVTRAERHA
jgi:tetratricopeptide (TPR) repeat protein